ncbi:MULTISPECIES: NAD(P)H-binding protein [unclassified Mesorhizobium]|uniref:SDR family oxidoreductase n=1 Tax=unclassified Mesorhizobium TaxID=325217 RepID=UPI000FD5D031|nr:MULTISPECIES: NAD(P)H-binding protein [unclassified Mesorhizobium]RUW99019.1 NAD-dependent epimerase/dehydratase family protein [Mesorhizobium sp. M8A.F.Ca.ET.023.01.1.1]TGU91932.1 NAD-dependent epimerase/dehydratase family protein [Mesorhizobium sp. M00.F.Ca.ET.151.01.1.1]TGV10549.1 NAD-dependent epimerase/dehydratase family protein [Mesorhizobium sp. M8A.F.Ca.ET.173.01.1.1]TGV53650.1 NAD-dependent epimerase/dehydratase family protein [bacterium M00.F.Ca.ET.141.01.1.1]RWC65779.1 MAG: NAD-d
MAKILVTGGTGHLGHDLVPALTASGHTVRLLAREARLDRAVEWALGDLATGEGIDEALGDVDTVIHAATLSPIARRGMRPIDFFSSPSDVDVEGTRRLLAASQRANVSHFIFVSIVGLDFSTLPYSRVKLAGEQLVRESPLSWSVIRATPFFYLLAQMLAGLRWLPVWLLPTSPSNPVDTRDVARYLAQAVSDGERGVRPQIGGPEVMPFSTFARQYRDVLGLRRLILPFPVSRKISLALGLVETSERLGERTWKAWLSEQGGCAP